MPLFDAVGGTESREGDRTGASVNHLVVAIATFNGVVRGRAQLEQVVTAFSIQPVHASGANQGVAAVATVDSIVTQPTVEQVIAGIAIKSVPAGAAFQAVGTAGTGNRIIPGAAVNDGDVD